MCLTTQQQCKNENARARSHMCLKKSLGHTRTRFPMQRSPQCAGAYLVFFGMPCRTRSTSGADAKRAHFCRRIWVIINHNVGGDLVVEAIPKSKNERTPYCAFVDCIVIVVIFSGTFIFGIRCLRSQLRTSAFTKVHHKNFHIVALALSDGVNSPGFVAVKGLR